MNPNRPPSTVESQPPSSTGQSSDQFNYLDTSTLSAPFEFYRSARRESPVFRVSRAGSRPDLYLITSYALIREVTQNPELFSSQFGHLLFERIGGNAQADAILKGGMKTQAGLLLVADGAQHKRYRALVNSVFTGVRVNKWSPVIERIADELIDSFIEHGECDFVQQFAIRLPTYVIADILGFDRTVYDRVTVWSDAIIRYVSQIHSPDEEIGAARLMVEFDHYLMDQIKQRRALPGEDLVSALIQSSVEGEPALTDDEIGPLIREIAVAGNETTRNTLMSGLTRLLKNPAQLQALIQDPALMPNAVEEILRYEVPASSMWRVATADTELAGVKIPKGAAILMRFDSANRDEAQFEDPEAFDIRRRNANTQISFGAPGIHRCLGQMLARKELTLAFQKLLQRLKNLRIVESKSDLAYWPGLMHRGIGALFLTFDPGERTAMGSHDEARIRMQR
jgi:cytochrome P450